MTENALVVADRAAPSHQAISVWQSPASFETAQRMATALSRSGMVPVAYQGPDNIGSALIALDIAQRVNASPLMVMQNLHIINGRPSWGASFIIAALNSCGLFSPLRFRLEDRGEREVEFIEWEGSKREGNLRRLVKKMKVRDKACVASCIEKATGEILDGPEASVAMAVAEGWYTKRDSKWPTMTDLMLRYRAAAFFGRLYAPDLLMGMQTDDEARDIGDVEYREVRAPEPAPAEPQADDGKPKRSRGVAAAMKAKDEPKPIETKPEPKADTVKAEPARVSSGLKPKQEAAPEVVDAEVVEPARDTRGSGQGDDGDDEGRFPPDSEYDEQDGDSI